VVGSECSVSVLLVTIETPTNKETRFRAALVNDVDRLMLPSISPSVPRSWYSSLLLSIETVEAS